MPSFEWSRREVLGAAVAAALVPTAAMAGDVPVVVLGGGIAGLSAALRLHDAGIPCRVLEGSGRLGGRIFSTTGELGEDLVLERGAEFVDTDHHDVLDLVDRFGLPLFDRRADERAHPSPPASAFQFGDRTLSEAEVAERLRPLARRMRRDARRLRRRFDRVIAELDGMSGRDYLEAADPVARALCEAIIRSDYGVEPASSSAAELLYSLPRVRGDRVDVLSQSDEVYSVIGGNQRLIDAMAGALPDGTIQRRAWVARIEERPGGGFDIGLRGGERVRARFVICTIPFTVLRTLELVFQDPEPKPLLAAVQAYQLGRNEKVVLGVHRRVWLQPRGFRGELWSDQGLVWDASRTQPDHPSGALAVFLGGRQVDALVSGHLDARSVARRFAPTLPALPGALTGEMVVTRWRDNPFSLGAYTTLRPGQLSTGPFVAWPQRGEPESATVAWRGFVVAGEHVSDAHYGYVNGAAETGRRAAEAVVAARRFDA